MNMALDWSCQCIVTVLSIPSRAATILLLFRPVLLSAVSGTQIFFIWEQKESQGQRRGARSSWVGLSAWMSKHFAIQDGIREM